MRILTDVVHRPAQVLTRVVRLFLGLALFSTPVFAQTLTVEPACGVAGSSVKIGGSGWAEPVPICDYHFLFDGATFASKQPDGLFGPPNRTATIPTGATPGDHKIKVELRLTSGNTLLQCRQTTFKVVTAVVDPFAGNITPAVGGTAATGTIDFIFDPTNVCDVTPCTRLAWIQSLKIVGVRADGTTEVLKWEDVGFAANTYDQNTQGGVTIDRLFDRPFPYYGSDLSGNSPTSGTNRSGVQNGTPRSANMQDTPSNWGVPTGFAKVRGEFESNLFCAEGQNSGTFPGGKVIWTWESTGGSTGTATVVSATRDQPTPAFLAALTKWDTNRETWAMPTPASPTTGGEACP